MTLQQKYPEGREVVCVKTYNPSIMAGGKKGDSDVIFFKGEFGVVIDSNKRHCIKIQMERNLTGTNGKNNHYINEIWADEHWELVP